MKMTTIRRSLGALALFLGTSVFANAATITYYVDVFGLGVATTTFINPTTSTLVGGGTSTVVSIPKLDQVNGLPDIGPPPVNHIWQLTQVALRLDWRVQATFQVANLSCLLTTCTDYTFSNGFTIVPIEIEGPDTTQNNVSATAGPASGTAFHTGPVTSFPGQVGSGFNIQNASNLAPYQGLGSGAYNVSAETGDFTASGSGSSGSAGKLFYGGDGMAGAILSVTYTYDAVVVPEPATNAIVGTALMGLSFLMYRRRRSTK